MKDNEDEVEDSVDEEEQLHVDTDPTNEVSPKPKSCCASWWKLWVCLGLLALGGIATLIVVGPTTHNAVDEEDNKDGTKAATKRVQPTLAPSHRKDEEREAHGCSAARWSTGQRSAQSGRGVRRATLYKVAKRAFRRVGQLQQ